MDKVPTQTLWLTASIQVRGDFKGEIPIVQATVNDAIKHAWHSPYRKCTYYLPRQLDDHVTTATTKIGKTHTEKEPIRLAETNKLLSHMYICNHTMPDIVWITS